DDLVTGFQTCALPILLEEKATQQHAFFEWLEKISTGLNLDDPVWLRDVSRHYLSRKEPKEDWQAKFEQIHAIRRSRRLDSGWEGIGRASCRESDATGG